MKKLWVIGLMLLLFMGCHRPEKFPDEPYIEFVSLGPVSLEVGKYNLVVYFQDGDGDIGLSDSDTTGVFATDSMYYYNFFIDYFEKQNGEWVKIDLPLPLHCRIPRLSNVAQESISGQITLLTYVRDPASPYDTTKLSCYLVDRALHKSNVIETPEIVRK